jgi:hypothetical protein
MHLMGPLSDNLLKIIYEIFLAIIIKQIKHKLKYYLPVGLSGGGMTSWPLGNGSKGIPMG